MTFTMKTVRSGENVRLFIFMPVLFSACVQINCAVLNSHVHDFQKTTVRFGENVRLFILCLFYFCLCAN